MESEAGNEPWYRSQALWWIAIGYAGLIVALCWAWLPRVEFIPTPALGSLADWSAAAGSFAAVVTALWLSRESRRQSEREQKIKAEIFAARIADRLNHAVRTVRFESSEARWSPPVSQGDVYVGQWQNERVKLLQAAAASSAFNVDADTLMALAPLRDSAKLVARASVDFASLAQDIERVLSFPAWRNASPAIRDPQLRRWRTTAQKACHRVEPALRECRIAGSVFTPAKSDE